MKLQSKQWIILAIIQIILAWYFFSNLQTFLTYQNLPNGIFENLGFNQFLFSALFSDALLLFILSLPFLNHHYLRFISVLLLSMLAISFSLSIAGNLNYNYLIYLAILWFSTTNLIAFMYLKCLNFFKIKWLTHLILMSFLIIFWTVFPFLMPFKTIPHETKALLSKMTQPLEIKVFISEQHPQKNRLFQFLKNYQQIQPLIKIIRVSPATAPAQINAFSIAREGELLLQYEGRFKKVEQLTDYAVTQAFQELLNLNYKKLIFLEGHGERSLNTNLAFDFSMLNTIFHNQNIEMISQSFLPNVDRQTLLIIANPRQPLNNNENQQLIDYLKRGGNLLWLLEPALENDGLSGLNKTAQFLGLKLLDGYVSTKQNNLLEISHFSLLENLHEFSVLFPETAALQLENDFFNVQPFISISNAQLTSFDNKKLQENQSIFNIGFSLERIINNQTQRIIILGDSDFMSNAYIEKKQNAKLVLESINWLTETPELIKVAAHKIHDTRLTLDFYLQMGLTGFFLFILPVVFIILAYRQKIEVSV